MPLFNSKNELYQNVLKIEFIREFHALVDAANERREFKADFTDKISSLLLSATSSALNAANISMPIVPDIINKGLNWLVDKGNAARKEEKAQYFLEKAI